MVVYHGQPIGAIAAETREIAQKAAGMVEVTYEDQLPILTVEVCFSRISLEINCHFCLTNMYVKNFIYILNIILNRAKVEIP